jgi:death on curing protein
MKYLTLEQVYAIHQKMIIIGDGRAEIHDFTLLHSAVERPKASFGRRELYPTIWLKAAALLHSLIKNHPFDDGNKRTAYYSTMRFLFINGYLLEAKLEEVVKLTKSVDVKNLLKNEIANWLRSHSSPLTI